jgi:hypothetical protein
MSPLQSWRWRQCVPPKCWYLPTSPHGVTTQKIIDLSLSPSTIVLRSPATLNNLHIWYDVVNPLKNENNLNRQIFKNPVPTSKKTQRVSTTTINWLTLFKEIIAVNCANHTKPMNTHCGKNTELVFVIAGGTYSYHWTLKG